MDKNEDWKSLLGRAFSIDTESICNVKSDIEESMPKEKQQLRIKLEKRNRAGKEVTILTGYEGTVKQIEDLSRLLKNRLAAGGSVKDNSIIIQGNVCNKMLDMLQRDGYIKTRVL